MKAKKLNLSRLSVRSFVTSLPLGDEEKDMIKGGDSTAACPQPTVSTVETCATFGERGVDILG